jgi:hypothetical protein
MARGDGEEEVIEDRPDAEAHKGKGYKKPMKQLGFTGWCHYIC